MIRPTIYRAQDVFTHQWVHGYYIDEVTGAIPIIITEIEMDDYGNIGFDYHFVDAETVEVEEKSHDEIQVYTDEIYNTSGLPSSS